jgi:pyruvate formate lyase activating enzyme
MKGIVFDIKRFAIHDGPGIRTTVFLKGCPLRCWWCHNPESQHVKSETDVKKILLDGISFEKTETVGRLMSVEEVMEILVKESVFYDESGGGVTFSGGEPMLQPEFLTGLLKSSKEKGFHTAIDTSGFARTEHFDEILGLTDLFLFDLKHTNDAEHKNFTGVSNRLILKNLRFLTENNAHVIIRIPLIPGINSEEDEIGNMIELLNNFDGKISEVHLLPYHDFAKNKYRRFEKENKLINLQAMEKSQIQNTKSKFETEGFLVKIGG